jgi:Leucine-rich repeat (LRR) protein
VNNKKIEGLDHLVKLENLSLEDNKIKKIEGLTQLRKLKRLNLFGNDIKTIERLGTLELLEELRIGGNPILHTQLEKCGGLDGKGYALIPQEFVRYCRK